MRDPVLVTLLSAAISAFITATGTVIAAYIAKSRENKEEPKTATILKLPGYAESKARGFWNKRSIAVILFALISITVITRALLLPKTTTVELSVFSAPYPFASTGITVNAGDEVEITATGAWDCGRSNTIGPEGYLSEQYSDTVFMNAPACALIGGISSTPPNEKFDGYFMVGVQKTWIAQETGKLYLGCNDSIGKFSDNPTDSRLDVKITVRH